MANFKMPRRAQYPDYPDNDKDRVDIIFRVFLDKDSEQHHLFTNILSQQLQWTVSLAETKRLENIIITSGLITAFPHPNSNFSMLWLNHEGRRIIGAFGSYSAYKESDEKKSNKSSVSFDDYCTRVLFQIEIENDHVSEIVKKLRIDTSLSDGIQSYLNIEGFIGLTNTGAYITPKGKAQLARIRIDGMPKENPVRQETKIYHGDVIHNEGVMVQGSHLESVDFRPEIKSQIQPTTVIPKSAKVPVIKSLLKFIFNNPLISGLIVIILGTIILVHFKIIK